MSDTTFLKIDGLPGESSSVQGKDQIEILSFSHGVSMPISHSAASSVSVKHGRCVHQDVTISKYLDITSSKLNLICSGGDNIKTVELSFWMADKAAGDMITYYKIELEDVLITSISIGGGGDRPVETVTFHYNKIKWTYTPQTRDAPGGKKGVVPTGWDLEQNKSV